MRNMSEKEKFRDKNLRSEEVGILKKLENHIKFGFTSQNMTVNEMFIYSGDVNSIGKDIAKLHNLKKIGFDHEPVSNIPKWLQECKSLQNLSFSYQKLTGLEYIGEILSDPNFLIPFIGITGILTPTIIAILLIHRNNVKKMYIEYKQIAKEERTELKKRPKSKEQKT